MAIRADIVFIISILLPAMADSSDRMNGHWTVSDGAQIWRPQVIHMDPFLEKFPPTVEQCVDKLIADMNFADKTRMANMSDAALIRFHRSYGIFLRNEFRLPGNDPLMKSCLKAAYLKTITPEQASYVIVKALQHRLQQENTLRVVK